MGVKRGLILNIISSFLIKGHHLQRYKMGLSIPLRAISITQFVKVL